MSAPGKVLSVTCGTHRHPQEVRVTHIRSIDDDLSGVVLPDVVVLTLKPRHWIVDTWGDRQWHGTVCADRAAVASLLFKRAKP